MNESWTTTLSILLVVLGVLAEVNLLSVFLGDWWEARREGKARRFRPASDHQSTMTLSRRKLMRSRLAACAMSVAIPGTGVLAQPATPIESDNSGTIGEHARPTLLTLADTRLTLSLQPTPQSGESPKPVDSHPLTISTNRPSFDDTAGIVPIGHFQLETGFTFTYRNREGSETQSWNAPELLGRIPLLDDRLELQVGTSGLVWSRSDSGSGFDSTQGWSDATIGLRLKVVDQDKWVPRIALQASTTIGAGTDGISNQDAEPTFKLIWSYDLGDGWGIYGNLGLAYPTTNGDRFLQGQAGVCVTKTLDDKWSVFGEYYVFGPNAKGADAAHYMDVGAAYIITPRIQIDGRVGFGLNQEANNVFTGFGISFLF